MKRNLVLATAAVIALVGMVPASAQAQTAFDGFYAGASGGAVNNRRTLDLTVVPSPSTTSSSNSAALTTHIRSSSASLGAQAKVFAGYNMVFDRWLVGGEVAYQPDVGNDQRAYLAYQGNIIGGSSRGGTYSVVGRLGYQVLPDLVVYGFGGWAGQQVDTSVQGVSSLSNRRFANGFTGGLGAEYALTSNVFLRGEVQYTEITSKSSYLFTNQSTGATSQGSARNRGSRFGGTIGIGYRF